MANKISLKELNSELTRFNSIFSELEDVEAKINNAITIISESGFKTLSHGPMEKLNKLKGVVTEEKESIATGVLALRTSIDTFENVDKQLAKLMGDKLDITQDYRPSDQEVDNDYFTYTRNGDNLVAKPGNVYVWNEVNKELSCTYYTLRKLYGRGLVFPVNRAGSGRQFIENLEKSGVKDIPYKREGNKSLEALINDNGLPMDNVVLSFDWKKGTYTGDNMGHVVLIDHIKENEKGEKICIFSDMNTIVLKSGEKVGKKITSINGSNPQVEMPLDQFLEYYGKKNNLNGAAVIGAGK